MVAVSTNWPLYQKLSKKWWPKKVLKMKTWIYWSESNSWIYFYIFLNKNWNITVPNKVWLVFGLRTCVHYEDCVKHIMTLSIKTIMSALKVLTNIFTSIAARPIRFAEIPITNFKTTVILYLLRTSPTQCFWLNQGIIFTFIYSLQIGVTICTWIKQNKLIGSLH